MALQEELVVVAGRQCHIVCGTDAPLCMVVKPLGPFEWRCLMEECLLTEQLAAIPFVMVAFDMDNLDSFRQPDWATRDFVVEQLMSEMRHRFGNIPVVLGGAIRWEAYLLCGVAPRVPVAMLLLRHPRRYGPNGGPIMPIVIPLCRNMFT